MLANYGIEILFSTLGSADRVLWVKLGWTYRYAHLPLLELGESALDRTPTSSRVGATSF